jgi:hypothetical protein
MQFPDDSGISVNRGSCSEARDVLEPDCCDGRHKSGCVVLEFVVSEVPRELTTTDGTNRIFHFPMKHIPLVRCYPHSEIWCNQTGNIGDPYEKPPKQIKDRFRVALAERIAERVPLQFEAVRDQD